MFRFTLTLRVGFPKAFAVSVSEQLSDGSPYSELSELSELAASHSFQSLNVRMCTATAHWSLVSHSSPSHAFHQEDYCISTPIC